MAMTKLIKKFYNFFKSAFINNKYTLKNQFKELEARFVTMEKTNLAILKHLIVAVATSNLEPPKKETKNLEDKTNVKNNHTTKKDKFMTNILRTLHAQDKNPTYH